MKIKLIIILTLVFLLIITSLILWLTGVFDIWSNGIQAFLGQKNNFTTAQSHPVEGAYSFSVDFEHLENKRTSIYTDEECTISQVVTYEPLDTFGDYADYIIELHSQGTYSPAGARLVSFMRYDTGLGFTNEPAAQLTVEYKGKTYICKVLYSWLSEDGDDIRFHVFPENAYETDGITSKEKGTAKFTITGLYKNIWTRK